MIAFIDVYRDRFLVEFMCREAAKRPGGLLTSRSYRAAKTRKPSTRALRDDMVVEEIRRIDAENCAVYRIWKMWHTMRRAGWDVGRDQIARLMNNAGVPGVGRGCKPVTTRSPGEPDIRPDLVKRSFTADRPNQLWVADITYVKTAYSPQSTRHPQP